MTITSMISRPLTWIALATALCAASGCLPEFDEPPLTATGEAPASESPSTSSSATGAAPAASSCTGVFSGNLPAGANFAGQTPCTINGNVDMSSLTAAERQQVTGVKNIQGTLFISAPVHISQLPALTSVYALTASGYSSPTLDFPSRIAVQHSITISGGQLNSIKGFGGVKSLAATLTIQSLGSLESIDAFHALGSVKTISVNELSELKIFKGFTVLTTASIVDIANCQALTALPTFGKLTNVAALQIGYMGAMSALASFPVLTSVNSLNVNNLDAVASVSFPALKTVTSFHVSGMAKLADLEGFGPELKIVSSVLVCNILMKGADREVWKAKHAPTLNFSACSNGCFGWGTC